MCIVFLIYTLKIDIVVVSYISDRLRITGLKEARKVCETTMREKRRAILTLILCAGAIALLAFTVLVGLGKWNRGKINNIILGLDLEGGVSITYEADPGTSDQKMEDVREKLENRAESFSTESSVYREGDLRIVVDIPGADDAEEVLKSLGASGSIEFLDEANTIVLDGKDISNAEAVIVGSDNKGTINNYQIKLTLNSQGKTKFAKATAANIGKTISIRYDGEVLCAPVVESTIDGGEAYITNMKNFDEAKEVATFIRIGALPVELHEVRSNVVGAKLGSEAISTSLLAGAIGLALIILFMIAMYRVPGFVSGLALVIYMGTTLVVINALNITLTLPGIAGIILSIGMAVDANVIIFTRIKEEIAAGKSVPSSVKLGFDKAMSAIIDGNVTTLIAAAVLGKLGSGTIKGFAYTLAIGIVLSMFTALFVTRTLLNAFLVLGCNKEKFYGRQKEFKTINFIKKRVVFFTIALVCMASGFVAMGVNKTKGNDIFNYGLDFVGGTSMTIYFEQDVPENKDIEEIFAKELDEVAEVAPVVGEKAVVVKTNNLSEEERSKISDALVKAYKVNKEDIQTENISATVSGEMKESAIKAVLIATIAMLIYIWFRFKSISFGLGAVLALLHDVCIVIGVYAITRLSVGNTFIACVLTIVGYSINATIVTFDRIRENRKAMRKDETIEDVVNKSVTQTMSRSIYTSLTTFVTVLMLYILGVESIKQFSLPIMAGIIAGTYSSICIAGSLWYTLAKRIDKKQLNNDKKNPPKKDKVYPGNAIV